MNFKNQIAKKLFVSWIYRKNKDIGKSLLFVDGLNKSFPMATNETTNHKKEVEKMESLTIDAIKACTIKETVRFCDDIGMHALDRPCTTCMHRTVFCKKHCYNGKLYKIYKLDGKDARNESAWAGLDDQACIAMAKKLSKSKKDTSNRFRLMTRGEALSTKEDFAKVDAICKAMGKRLVWLPTRAWRKEAFFHEILGLCMRNSNLRLLLSLDPSNCGNPKDEVLLSKYLDLGFSTMFFGDNTAKDNGLTIAWRKLEFKACPKTWEKKHGHCATCKGGCFSPAQVHVHLKQH